MKFKEIFMPDVWRMLLTLTLIAGYYIFNDFLVPNICRTPPSCIIAEYHYNSPNFFGKQCGDCISYNGFIIDLVVYLIMQFIFPYILACLILAFSGYGTSSYGESFKFKKNFTKLAKFSALSKFPTSEKISRKIAYL